MTDIQLISQFASLGLGGVIALVVLVWKREDEKRWGDILQKMAERTESREARILQVIESFTTAIGGLQRTIDALVQTSKLDERFRDIEKAVYEKRKE